MKRQPTNTMTDTKIAALSSKKQLLEQLQSEQQEVNALTQPLLETEAGFIKNLDHYLTHRDALDLRKSKLLYKRWTQSVWLPVQRSIKQHFTHHGYNETQRMRSMHVRYINYCNAKGFVFLESYDPWSTTLSCTISTPIIRKFPPQHWRILCLFSHEPGLRKRQQYFAVKQVMCIAVSRWRKFSRVHPLPNRASKSQTLQRYYLTETSGGLQSVCIKESRLSTCSCGRGMQHPHRVLVLLWLMTAFIGPF